ncbi:hypothetical protein M413DRAFT_75568 [Hebeloma cylindrosporum]|uniref:Peptidase metallopeptidase domain-containing protein n=1 Tax=Hebeloma cylindrosporum TaxID=76867 RepID=A0A0C3BQ89_HEBCY|nr:hypothetical protein M413DRAFT_75568 [Hebeloma cylindrosporum h7]
MTEQIETSWHQFACAEANVDHAKSTLANTDASRAGAHAAHAVLVRSGRMWDNGITLTYGFLDRTNGSPVQKIREDKVRRTIPEWSKYANISFSFQQDGTPQIRIAFDPKQGSWSYVGNENTLIDANKATMNLGWLDGSSDAISDDERGVILHEFGHALGLLHEHQSPLRGDKITLKESAVIDFYTTDQGWSKQEVEDQIIRVFNTSEISNFSEVDLTSIMMYFMPPEMNEQGIRIRPNNKLSDTDKAFLTINYPFFTNSDSGASSDASKQATVLQKFNDALDIAGVAGDTRQTILDYFAQRDWQQIRYTFTDWCTSTRLARKAAQGAKPTDDADLPSWFTQGCLTDSLTDELKSSTSGAGAARGVVTRDKLWTPGQTVTYAFLQGATFATPYRIKRVKDTLNEYAGRANLNLKEVPWSPTVPPAHIRIWFGDIPKKNVTGWSVVAKDSIGYVRSQAAIDLRGGSVDSSIVFSLRVIPADEAPSSSGGAAQKQESRVLYHELGHALGLQHEHASPNTKTTDTDKLNESTSIATFYDEHSVMLYPGRGLLPTEIKNHLDPRTTAFNSSPSEMDYAFLSALYPFPTGHDSDQLDANLKVLGLSATQSADLVRLRDHAFKVQGLQPFQSRIKDYHDKLDELMRVLTAAHSIKNSVPPSHFNSVRDAQVNPPAKATTGPFLDELMKTLSAFFKPTTGQIFALQFPGRFLQQDLYAWDTNKAGIYGQFVKPTVVNESEFRLVDQLYNVGQVIGAPNGINLSIVYEHCLNNLVPGIPTSAIKFQKQQSQIRGWLLKDVPTSGWVKNLIAAQHTTGTTTGASSTPITSGPAGAARSINASSAINPDSKPQFAVVNKLINDKVNRMELSQALMQEYLVAKQVWETQRDDMIKNEKGEDLDALTRRLAHTTAIHESQLASKYADAVVRGYSHVIRQYLGYMDIKTPAESLQDAKDALRESAVSSLDGSMKIYPIQMSPVDWFQSLSTSFTMEDLTMNADVIAQQLDIRSRQIDDLNARLALMQANPKQSVKDLQQNLDRAQEAYDKASAELSARYTSNVISLAKTCINKKNEFSMADFSTAAKKSKIAVAAFDNIEEGMNKLIHTQLAVTQTSRALTSLMAAKSLAEASDTAQEIIELQVQITALQRDVTELTSRLQTLRYQPPADPPKTDASGNPKPPSVEDIDLYPPQTSSGGSRWQEMYMKHTVDTKYNASSEQSSASTRSTNVGLFFGSYHSESGQSTGSSTSTQFAQSVDVEVGFRATLVTVDRGGWFQPQFFKQSAGFHSIDKTITWSKWPASMKTFQDLVNNDDKGIFDELNTGLIPAYPTGFVVCKDITIRIRMQETDIQAAGAEIEKYAATSAGILCWSTSSSDRSKSSEKSYSFVQKSDGCVIRIPGPQILGYMLQLTDNDESTELPEALPKDFLLSDADYDSAFADKPAPRSVDPSTAKAEHDSALADKPAPRSVDPSTANATTPVTNPPPKA